MALAYKSIRPSQCFCLHLEIIASGIRLVTPARGVSLAAVTTGLPAAAISHTHRRVLD